MRACAASCVLEQGNIKKKCKDHGKSRLATALMYVDLAARASTKFDCEALLHTLSRHSPEVHSYLTSAVRKEQWTLAFRPCGNGRHAVPDVTNNAAGVYVCNVMRGELGMDALRLCDPT